MSLIIDSFYITSVDNTPISQGQFMRSWSMQYWYFIFYIWSSGRLVLQYTETVLIHSDGKCLKENTLQDKSVYIQYNGSL